MTKDLRRKSNNGRPNERLLEPATFARVSTSASSLSSTEDTTEDAVMPRRVVDIAARWCSADAHARSTAQRPRPLQEPFRPSVTINSAAEWAPAE